MKSARERRATAPARPVVACLMPLVLAIAASPNGAAPARAEAVAGQAAQRPAKPADAKPADAKQAAAAPKPAPAQRFDIDDFAIQGAETLPEVEIEEAVYPFLGPNKSADDVEKARVALEKAYHDKGYQTVSVAVPQQDVARKVIVLKVSELKVGRLRVKNSRYFDLDKIKHGASSLKEGAVPNFNDVTKDIVGLNQWADRRVTPALRAGVTPGTVDVDLNVEDKAPIHASVEVNNRYSPNTTELRVASTVHYDNLWQLGHSASFTYQVAPDRPKDAEVFSGSYLARIPDLDWLSVLAYAVKSNSDVATVGGTNIIGPGQIIGGRAVLTLPSREGFFHTLSVGLDYKHFDQTTSLASSSFQSPVTYYPVVASYTATFQNDKFLTQFNASYTYNLRPLSSDWAEFDAKRYYASPSFSHFNVDVSHTQELGQGFQLFGRVQGQVADGPLVSSEEFSLGGFDTVRGYLETETLGDDGVAGTIELRAPNIGEMLQKEMKDETGTGPARFVIFNEWRPFIFSDAGRTRVLRPLAEQDWQFDLASYGVGSRFKLMNYLNGAVVLAVPLISQTYTKANDPRVNFRIWGEF